MKKEKLPSKLMSAMSALPRTLAQTASKASKMASKGKGKGEKSLSEKLPPRFLFSVASIGGRVEEEVFREWATAMRNRQADEALAGLAANPQWINFRSLSWAIEAHCDAVVSELAGKLDFSKHKAPINFLEKAAGEGSGKCVEALLPYFDPKATNAHYGRRQTPLMMAVITGNMSALNALLPVSDQRAVDYRGHSALQMSLINPMGAGLASLPLIPGGDLWAPCKDSAENALHLAIVKKAHHCVPALIERMKGGITPDQWKRYWVLAAESDVPEIVNAVAAHVDTFAPILPGMTQSALIVSMIGEGSGKAWNHILPRVNVKEQMPDKTTALSWAAHFGRDVAFEKIWAAVPRDEKAAVALDSLEGLCAIGLGDESGIPDVLTLLTALDTGRGMQGAIELARRVREAARECVDENAGENSTENPDDSAGGGAKKSMIDGSQENAGVERATESRASEEQKDRFTLFLRDLAKTGAEAHARAEAIELAILPDLTQNSSKSSANPKNRKDRMKEPASAAPKKRPQIRL